MNAPNLQTNTVEKVRRSHEIVRIELEALGARLQDLYDREAEARKDADRRLAWCDAVDRLRAQICNKARELAKLATELRKQQSGRVVKLRGRAAQLVEKARAAS